MAAEKPQLLIPLASWQKLYAYVDLCVGEVTGFFDVEWDDNRKAFVMGEVYLIKQEAGGADVEMNEDDIAEFTEEMIMAGRDQMPRGWWHSHVNMGAFFSGTDDQTIDVDFQNDTFTVSLVVNKRREMKCSIVYYNLTPPSIVERPYLEGMYKESLRMDECPVKLDIDLAAESIPDDLKAEVEEKVTTRRIPVYQHQGNQGAWKKNTNKKANTLPKDKEKALEKIEALDLYRQWDTDFGEMVYVNRGTGEIWRDIWSVIQWEDYKQLRGDKALFLKPSDGSPTTRRCLNCGHWEGIHAQVQDCKEELYADDLPGYDDRWDGY